jgi:hypothetical protein
VSSITSFTRARGLRLLAPVQNQSLPDPLEDVPRDLLDLLTFLCAQFWPRSGQEVEHRQLLFRQLLPYVALLLVGQGLR